MMGMKNFLMVLFVSLLFVGTNDLAATAGETLTIKAKGRVEYNLPAGRQLSPLRFGFILTNNLNAPLYLNRVSFQENNPSLANLHVDLTRSTCTLGISAKPIPAKGSCVLAFAASLPWVAGDYTKNTATVVDAASGINKTTFFGVKAT